MILFNPIAMKKNILIILMALLPLADMCADDLTPTPISIVPNPVRIVPGNGNFTISAGTVFSVENQEQAAIARNFIGLFTKSSGITPQLTRGKSEKSQLRFTTDSSLKAKRTYWKLLRKTFRSKLRIRKDSFMRCKLSVYCCLRLLKAISR